MTTIYTANIEGYTYEGLDRGRPVTRPLTRIALHPLWDTNPLAIGPKMPFRVVFQNGEDSYLTSCRGLDGGSDISLRGHREFWSMGEAVAWLMGDDDAGRPADY